MMDSHYTCNCICKRPSETEFGLVIQLSKPAQKCFKQAAEKLFLYFLIHPFMDWSIIQLHVPLLF